MNRDHLPVSIALLLFISCVYYRDIGTLLPALLLPAAAHELGHLAALWLLGLRIESIRLEVRGVCIRYSGACGERGHIAAALAGPMGGLLYSASLLLLRLGRVEWLRISAQISLLLTAFNLLPILPLDGGQVFVRLCHNALGVEVGERLYRGVSNAILALALTGGIVLICTRQASAPLAASIWLLLFQNDRQTLVKNGEVL